MPHVITVTPAASIDRSYYLDSLVPGAVHRATRVTEELAGKGINVGQALTLAGLKVSAIVPLPVREHERWSKRPWVQPVTAGSPVRVSITVLEPDGTTTKINENAPPLESEVWSAIVRAVSKELAAGPPRFVAVCGSLPSLVDGKDLDLVPLKSLAAEAGAQLVVDTSGPLLRAWSKAGLPEVIKPNAGELAECVGRALHTIGDVIDAATEVHSWGVRTILVSLGVDGMIGLSDHQVVHAIARPVTVVSTIGAGDASLAGFLEHSVRTPDDFAGAVANAVAWGSAKVTQDGSQLSSIDSLPVVDLNEAPSRDVALRELATPSTNG